MTDEQKMVLEFHRKFGQPSKGGPRLMSIADAQFRCGFLEEEVGEFRVAAESCKPIEMIDGLCDIIYVAHGTALFMGVDLEDYYREVHRSNMAKEGGATRADGKICKPAGWKRPDLASIYARHGGK